MRNRSKVIKIGSHENKPNLTWGSLWNKRHSQPRRVEVWLRTALRATILPGLLGLPGPDSVSQRARCCYVSEWILYIWVSNFQLNLEDSPRQSKEPQDGQLQPEGHSKGSQREPEGAKCNPNCKNIGGVIVLSVKVTFWRLIIHNSTLVL